MLIHSMYVNITLDHSSSSIQEVVELCNENSVVLSDLNEDFSRAYNYSVGNTDTIEYLRIFI